MYPVLTKPRIPAFWTSSPAPCSRRTFNGVPRDTMYHSTTADNCHSVQPFIIHRRSDLPVDIPCLAFRSGVLRVSSDFLSFRPPGYLRVKCGWRENMTRREKHVEYSTAACAAQARAPKFLEIKIVRTFTGTTVVILTAVH